MIDAFPLCWPAGWPRTKPAERKNAPFGKRSWSEGAGRAILRELSINDGVERLLAELGRLGVDRKTVVISTNLKLRGDGLPVSNQRQPEDVGVAVYWDDSKTRASRCMAIDIYSKIADNLGAIGASIEALRLIERHGGAQVLARAFTGFTALPAPGQTSARGWREVLFIGADGRKLNADEVRNAYMIQRSKWHPDRPGGNAEKFNEIQRAWDQARDELGLAP